MVVLREPAEILTVASARTAKAINEQNRTSSASCSRMETRILTMTSTTSFGSRPQIYFRLAGLRL